MSYKQMKEQFIKDMLLPEFEELNSNEFLLYWSLALLDWKTNANGVQYGS